MNVLELFAGAGGAALGLEAIGLHHTALVEWDPIAAETLRRVGYKTVFEGDVRAFTVPVRAELLWASPPCQPFSDSGKRLGTSDVRDMGPATLDQIRARKPRWVVIENVVSSVHNPAGAWAKELRASGLYPFVEVWDLNARDYGIPQDRVRHFVIAGPRPAHRPRKMPPKSAAEVVPSLRGMFIRNEQIRARARSTNDVAPTLTTRRTFFVYPRDVGPLVSRPSNMKGQGGRILTVEEAAALQGFPPGYPFAGTKVDQQRQIGNAVPPPMAKAIARVVYQADIDPGLGVGGR